jgi:hypothetical protein
MAPRANRFVLRNLSLPARLTIATFLISVGVGYSSALIQLHFQHAPPGKLLPDGGDTADAYYGRTGMSQLERLMVMDEGKPFNGSGTMRQTFTSKSVGWKSAINRRAKEKKVSLVQAEEELRSERDGERLALIDWIRRGASQRSFERNSHVLSSHLSKHPITEEFVGTGSDGTPAVKVASIFETRCARCHSEGKGGGAAQCPLENWEQIHDYCEVETSDGGMSPKKLAQSTHVHLLGFAMLYGLTGLIVTLTSYPGWIRGLLGPFAMLAQVVEISFWWLARLDPSYGKAIVYTGCAVALGLFLQIILSLFNLFGKTGKLVLIVMILSACLGGYVIKERWIDTYLAKEAVNATVAD